MCDGERPSVDTSRWRRAAKRHACCACLETIPVGARYWSLRGLWDGSWQTFRHCVRCDAIWENALDIAQPGDVVLFDLSCGETLDPDDPAQALAFLLPTDPPLGAVPTATRRPSARGRVAEISRP